MSMRSEPMLQVLRLHSWELADVRLLREELNRVEVAQVGLRIVRHY